MKYRITCENYRYTLVFITMDILYSQNKYKGEKAQNIFSLKLINENKGVPVFRKCSCILVSRLTQQAYNYLAQFEWLRAAFKQDLYFDKFSVQDSWNYYLYSYF